MALPVERDLNDDARVLIVDDQPRNLDALEVMLEPTGCSLVRAQSADEALLCLLKHDFAAIVLDIQMPGMGGIELAQLIKGRKRSRDIPILFLTAHTVEEGDLLRGYDVGAVDYLTKPINQRVLQSKIGVFLEVFRKTHALARLNEALEAEIRERERVQEALRRANQDLETRVQQRTSALLRAHRGVRENEERLRMAMEIGRIAAWERNLATGDMSWSTDPELMFGFPPGAFGPGKRMFRVLHDDDRPRVEAQLEAALIAGGYETEYRLVRPDGSIVWVTDRGRVVRGDAHTHDRMLGVSRDVSAQRHAELERERSLLAARQARDEAERQSRLKDEFLATLSHELRTPMNMVLGWLDILTRGQPVRDTQSALEVIQRNARIQARLIDDLLDMNRLVSGHVQLEVSSVDLGAIVHATVQGLQPAADAKKVRLMTTLDPAASVNGDARRIQQVLWNLLHNAIKFTPQGGRVDVRVHSGDDRVTLMVDDSGQGISAAFLPYVFERFRQEDSSTTRRTSGLGIGLSIARHIVELHGGTITAASGGEGCGAQFVVELPTRAADAISPTAVEQSA
jgi:PAS domain S-box-containing protein